MAVFEYAHLIWNARRPVPVKNSMAPDHQIIIGKISYEALRCILK